MLLMTHCLPGGKIGYLFRSLSFAMRLWTGETSVNLGKPVFEERGSGSLLREALREIVAGMGIADINDHHE